MHKSLFNWACFFLKTRKISANGIRKINVKKKKIWPHWHFFSYMKQKLIFTPKQDLIFYVASQANDICTGKQDKKYWNHFLATLTIHIITMFVLFRQRTITWNAHKTTFKSMRLKLLVNKKHIYTIGSFSQSNTQ